jgi:hypothetical protein
VDVLQAIKRLVLRGNVLFTEKAQEEMVHDDLDEDLVYEAILNAPSILKRVAFAESSGWQARIPLRYTGSNFRWAGNLYERKDCQIRRP